MSDTTQQVPTLEHLRARRAEILALAEQYGAYNVRVFGSVARGNATSKSDVDLLVSFRTGTSLFELSGFWLDLKDLLGYDVSLISDGIDDSRFLSRIQADVVAL